MLLWKFVNEQFKIGKKLWIAINRLMIVSVRSRSPTRERKKSDYEGKRKTFLHQLMLIRIYRLCKGSRPSLVSQNKYKRNRFCSLSLVWVDVFYDYINLYSKSYLTREVSSLNKKPIAVLNLDDLDQPNGWIWVPKLCITAVYMWKVSNKSFKP